MTSSPPAPAALALGALQMCQRVLGFDLRKMIDKDSPDYNQAVRDAYDSVTAAIAAPAPAAENGRVGELEAEIVKKAMAAFSRGLFYSRLHMDMHEACGALADAQEAALSESAS